MTKSALKAASAANKGVRSGLLRHLAIIAVGLLVLVAGVTGVRHFSPDTERTSSDASENATPTTSETPSGTPSAQETVTVAPPTEPGKKYVGKRIRFVRYPTVKQLDGRFQPKGLHRVSRSELKEFTFKVASYNVLGASHTTGPKGRPGYADYSRRLAPQMSLMESHGVSVAGLQEFQHPQSNMFARQRGGSYGIYPGVSLGASLSQNSIVWRTDTWEVVKRQTTPIPYFGGRRVPMPQVLLRHRASGRQVWFGNFHNPANIGGDHAHWRQVAVQIESNLAKSLGSDGTPVIMTGDMNDRERFACPFSQQSGMHSPNGARTTSGGCQTPPRMSVDWIFGSSTLSFSNYVEDWSSRNRHLSDHPIIAATVTAPGALDRPGCVKARARHGVEHYCPRP